METEAPCYGLLSELFSDPSQQVWKIASTNHCYYNLQREQLESRLQESRDQLNELKSNTNDRVNTLGSLVRPRTSPVHGLFVFCGVVFRHGTREFKIYDATAARTPQILHM